MTAVAWQTPLLWWRWRESGAEERRGGGSRATEAAEEKLQNIKHMRNRTGCAEIKCFWANQRPRWWKKKGLGRPKIWSSSAGGISKTWNEEINGPWNGSPNRQTTVYSRIFRESSVHLDPGIESIEEQHKKYTYAQFMLHENVKKEKTCNLNEPQLQDREQIRAWPQLRPMYLWNYQDHRYPSEWAPSHHPILPLLSRK